jgi:hypothetical protein
VRYVCEEAIDGKTTTMLLERFLEFVNPVSLTGEGLGQESLAVLQKVGLGQG